MVAPGDNLDIYESEPFKSRVQGNPDLAGEIVHFLKSWPTAGRELCPGTRLACLGVAGLEYGVFYHRKRNKIGLMYIFSLPKESKAMKEREKSVLTEVGKGGNHV